MKPLLALLTFVALATAARAEWADVKPGMDTAAVLRCVGAPLMQSKNRGLVQIWTYDHRGYIEFANGTVSYFEAPKVPAVTKTPTPSTHGLAQQATKLAKPIAKPIIPKRNQLAAW